MSLIVVPITLPNSTKNEADEAQGLKYLDRLGGFIYSIAIRNGIPVPMRSMRSSVLMEVQAKTCNSE